MAPVQHNVYLGILMIFDINNHASATSTRSNQSRVGSPSNDAKSAAPSPASTPNSSADRVQLSEQAQSMARVQSRLATTPEVDLDKVAAIKQAIAEGKFDFNPERIAENLLNQEALLG